MSHAITVAVTTVNAIKDNSLKHRQFQQYLQEVQIEYGDVFYFSKICLLSCGKCLKGFWNLRDKTKNFIKENCFDVLELEKN